MLLLLLLLVFLFYTPQHCPLHKASEDDPRWFAGWFDGCCHRRLVPTNTETRTWFTDDDAGDGAQTQRPLLYTVNCRYVAVILRSQCDLYLSSFDISERTYHICFVTVVLVAAKLLISEELSRSVDSTFATLMGLLSFPKEMVIIIFIRQTERVWQLMSSFVAAVSVSLASFLPCICYSDLLPFIFFLISNLLPVFCLAKLKARRCFQMMPFSSPQIRWWLLLKHQSAVDFVSSFLACALFPLDFYSVCIIKQC